MKDSTWFVNSRSYLLFYTFFYTFYRNKFHHYLKLLSELLIIYHTTFIRKFTCTRMFLYKF